MILELLKPVIEGFKKIDGKLNRKGASFVDMPDFYPTYKTACSYYEKIKIHAEIGTFPESLFKEHSPNMTQKEFDYMKGNYKQITLPVYTDYISTITRPFSDGNWGIEYTPDDETYVKSKQTFQEYVENEIEFFGSIENYLKSIIPHVKTKDANGVIVIKPLEFEYTDDLVLDTGKLYEPQPVYYCCEQVMNDPQFDNEYFIIHLEEKSSVNYAGKTDKKGHIFEIIDEQNIWHYEQIGNFSDYKFELKLYFNHNEGRIPASRLKGIPQLAGRGILWQSPFMFSVDILDLALMNANYLNVSLANTMFPYRVMIGNKCTYQFKDEENGNISVCDNGKIFSNNRLIDCPHCNGSGLRDRVSPLGVLLLNPSDMISEGDAKFSGKPLEYIAPSTESSRLMLDIIDSDLDKARQILHLHTTGEQMKGSGQLTATELGLDMKALYAFVKNVSDQMFALFEFMLDRIGWQRYGEGYKKPLVTCPVTFDFNTEEDYLNQITAAQQAKMPAIVIGSIIYKYLQTLYYNEKKTQQVFVLIINADRLMTATYEEVIAKYNLGLVQKWEVILHDSGRSLIDSILLEDENFFLKPLTEQIIILEDKAKLLAEETVRPVAVATSAAIGNILNPAAEETTEETS